jgi:hypothetical protein
VQSVAGNGGGTQAFIGALRPFVPRLVDATRLDNTLAPSLHALCVALADRHVVVNAAIRLSSSSSSSSSAVAVAELLTFTNYALPDAVALYVGKALQSGRIAALASLTSVVDARRLLPPLAAALRRNVAPLLALLAARPSSSQAAYQLLCVAFTSSSSSSSESSSSSMHRDIFGDTPSDVQRSRIVMFIVFKNQNQKKKKKTLNPTRSHSCY